VPLHAALAAYSSHIAGGPAWATIAIPPSLDHSCPAIYSGRPAAVRLPVACRCKSLIATSL